MKKPLLSLVTLVALVAFAVATAEAATFDNLSITVTITAGALSVNVIPGSWAIGSILESATPVSTFTTNNTRTNAPEDITLTAVSSANWTFANTPGANQFALNVSFDLGLTWSVVDSLAGYLIANDLPAGGSKAFDLKLLAPTSTTSAGVQQTITATVTASGP